MTRRAAPLLLLACARFDPPPTVELEGEQDGLLGDWGGPLHVRFSEAIEPDSLRVAVMHADLDAEGRLPNEDGDPATAPRVLLTNDPEALPAPCADAGDCGDRPDGGAAFDLYANTLLRITPDEPPPLGPPLALVVEPGLRDADGNATGVRARILFSYGAACHEEPTAEASLPSGPYFFLMAMEPPPVAIQLQLFAWIDVDAATQRFSAQFTDGDRLPALGARDGCPACEGGLVCRLLPEPDCALPSAELLSTDEWSDVLPVPEQPEGFSFTVRGCVRALAGGGSAFSSDPFDIRAMVGTATVDTRLTTFVGQFEPAADGRLRGAGRATVGDVALNGAFTGPTQGALQALALTLEELAAIESWGTSVPRPPMW